MENRKDRGNLMQPHVHTCLWQPNAATKKSERYALPISYYIYFIYHKLKYYISILVPSLYSSAFFYTYYKREKQLGSITGNEASEIPGRLAFSVSGGDHYVEKVLPSPAIDYGIQKAL